MRPNMEGAKGSMVHKLIAGIGIAALTLPGVAQSGAAQTGIAEPAAAAMAPANPGEIVIPAGTKVLLELQGGVNTKTAHVGDGVYLKSTFPVVAGDRVAIPPGVYVQGTIDSVVRPGRIKGRAAVHMHFTSMIFPNGSVVMIPGIVHSVPGSAAASVKDTEGTVEQSGSKGKDAKDVLTGGEIGAGAGSIGGAASGSPIRGAGIGAGAGIAAGLLYTLFTRGDDIAIPGGTAVEMELQQPLRLKPASSNAPTAVGMEQMGSPTPADGGREPLKKQPQHNRILCPSGLGCD